MHAMKKVNNLNDLYKGKYWNKQQNEMRAVQLINNKKYKKENIQLWLKAELYTHIYCSFISAKLQTNTINDNGNQS